MAKNTASKQSLDNRANQLNQQHPAYHRSRGSSPEKAEELARHEKSALDNHANQLNLQHPAYESSRDDNKE